MNRPEVSFGDILSPMKPEDFFDRYYGRQAVHVRGAAGKFAGVFSWDEFNGLLNMASLWTDQTMKMVLRSRNLEPEEFCEPGRTRNGFQAMRPSVPRMSELLQEGATLVLDLIEGLTPALSSVTASLETVTGGPASCNAYCSWNARQGFDAHFDTMDVFALHIEGSKTWRLYEGRAKNPIEAPGYNWESLPPEQRERTRGKLQQEVEMRPGDLLYIPRGQYHDALASSEACLHLSFGITQPTGQDFLTVLMRSLPEDPLFREGLPHFDDVASHDAHARKLADRLHSILCMPQTAEQMRQLQRQRVFRHLPGFALPRRGGTAIYRVCWRGVRLVRRGNRWILKTRSGEEKLAAGAAELAKWMLDRDYFYAEDLEKAFPTSGATALDATVGELSAAGILERV